MLFLSLSMTRAHMRWDCSSALSMWNSCLPHSLEWILRSTAWGRGCFSLCSMQVRSGKMPDLRWCKVSVFGCRIAYKSRDHIKAVQLIRFRAPSWVDFGVWSFYFFWWWWVDLTCTRMTSGDGASRAHGDRGVLCRDIGCRMGWREGRRGQGWGWG